MVDTTVEVFQGIINEFYNEHKIVLNFNTIVPLVQIRISVESLH